jgi:hypothetical protein
MKKEMRRRTHGSAEKGVQNCSRNTGGKKLLESLRRRKY